MAVPIVLTALKYLPGDERRRWLRGRRAALQVAMHGGTVARSTAYYLARVEPISGSLVEVGLITDTEPVRDVRSGRKVKSLLGELARLRYRDEADLAAVYEPARPATPGCEVGRHAAGGGRLSRDEEGLP